MRTCLSWIYGLVVTIRNKLYDCRWFVRKAPCRVISVGNIAVGGAGKTPLVLFLAQQLQLQGYHVAILSRGYGGKRKKTQTCVSTGKRILMSAIEAGDEPRMLAEKLEDIPIYVHPKRINIAEQACANHKIDICLLDDGFQHRKLHRDKDIVLINGQNPWAGGKLLPAGRLREPLRGLKRADMIVISKVDAKTDIEGITQVVRKFNPQAPIATTCYVPSKWVYLNGGKIVSLAELAGTRVIVVCALADPQSFLTTVEGTGVVVAQSYFFRDHHVFTKRDLRNILKILKSNRADLIAMSHKDAVRVDEDFEAPLIFLDVDLKIEGFDIKKLTS